MFCSPKDIKQICLLTSLWTFGENILFLFCFDENFEDWLLLVKRRNCAKTSRNVPDTSGVTFFIAGSYYKIILMTKRYARGSPKKFTSSSNLKFLQRPLY